MYKLLLTCSIVFCVVQQKVRHFRVASYRPQGKVMFSEAFVCLLGGGSTSKGGFAHPLVLTSSGGQCSGRYASYWNAFLLDGWLLRCFIQLPVKKLYSLSTLFFHFCPFCIIGSIVLCKVFLKGENTNRACYIFNIVTRVVNYHG